MNTSGILYLIPITLGDGSFDKVIPAYNNAIINEIDVYIVENIKTARRFLKKAGILKPIDELTFFEIDKRSETSNYPTYIKALAEGKNIGVLSEAGCPGVADPGAEIVALAQEKNFKVVPLVGPSSILLSLMASGFNGQSFCFNGYLPIDQKERTYKLRDLERLAFREKQTQLFIETPYRNMPLMKDILNTLNNNTKLCIAVDITLATEQILTKSIEDWKKDTKLDLNKRPCIFLIG